MKVSRVAKSFIIKLLTENRQTDLADQTAEVGRPVPRLSVGAEGELRQLLPGRVVARNIQGGHAQG